MTASSFAHGELLAALESEVEALRAQVQAAEDDADRLAAAMREYAAEVSVDCWADCHKEGATPAHLGGCYGTRYHDALALHDRRQEAGG